MKTKAEVCGCCELPAGTPILASNRPVLSAIVFRAGTYSSFRQAMLDRLAGGQALRALQTRSDDDYAITVLDMWATVADVLTFYQERIANEGFLRTSRLRDSVLRLARLLDYQLSPGVAATTWLSFTLDRNAAFEIPMGLRVQSVPGPEEKPQIYETLAAFRADSRLNIQRILPAPEGFNPLAKGSTSGFLSPGAEGLVAVAALSPGAGLIVFAASGVLEELTVRELRVDEERLSVHWSGPIQGTGWSFRSPVYAFGRKFRVFGHNAPTEYMEALETPAASGKFIWTRRTFTSASYAYTPLTGNILELDAKYEGISVGTRLLISQPGLSNALATVIAVSQGPSTFKAPAAVTSPVQDTVTRVTLSSVPASIADRRTTVIYEITSPQVRFWGYRYPERLSGSTVHMPGRRTGPGTLELGGTVLELAAIQVGRDVIVHDLEGAPILAQVGGVAAIGLDPGFSTTPGDLTTTLELRLDPEQSQQVAGLRSADLPAVLALTSASPELTVTLGSLPSRTLKLGSKPPHLAAAATALQASLTASSPIAPEFAACRVTQAENTLVVLTGVPDLTISFGPTSSDPTTAVELGLVAPGAVRIDALLSGSLTPFPTLSNPLRELSVSFGPIGPRTIKLTSAPGNLAAAAVQLQAALAAVDPAPAFVAVFVKALDGRLLVLPGTGGASIQDLLAVTLETALPLPLETRSAVLLGNVAHASHGEKVTEEVLGNGDASTVFQAFELAKPPLTYLPSPNPGGTLSTLGVLINGVRWSEVPSLFGRGPSEQVYTTRIADDGTVRIAFGDGRTGARLPSGQSNVIADYRQGSGLTGRVGRGALRTPLDLPVGLKSVSNPVPASGGADPESLEQARANAPMTVRTFGRAVSLRDFEDLVRSSGEVAKSHATWVWNHEARAVHVTVAAQGGAAFAPSDLRRLQASLEAARDPNHALFLDNHARAPIVVAAKINVATSYVASKVAEAARQAFLSALSFDVLAFGQPLALSEVIAILQRVAGVSSVDVDLFHFKERSPAALSARGATADPVQRSLRIFSARPNTLAYPPVLPAELATVDVPAEDVQLFTSGGLPD